MVYTRHGLTQIKSDKYRTIDECHHTIVRHYRNRTDDEGSDALRTRGMSLRCARKPKKPPIKVNNRARVLSIDQTNPSLSDHINEEAAVVLYDTNNDEDGDEDVEEEGQDVEDTESGDAHTTVCDLNNVSHMSIISKSSDSEKTHNIGSIRNYGYECYLSKQGDLHRQTTKKDYDNRISERRYFVDTAHCLYDYYQQRNGIQLVPKAQHPKRTCRSREHHQHPSLKKSRNILSFIASPAQPHSNTSDCSGDRARGSNSSIEKKDKVASSYKRCVDPNAHASGILVSNTDSSNLCNSCGARDVVTSDTDSTRQCRSCGICVYIPILQATPSFKKARTTRPNMTVYKRINHFNDWLSQFQAKENMTVSDDVYSKIIQENAKKSYGTRRRRITQTGLRKVLRKLGLTKYYEHIPHIIQHLQGTKPPKLTREMEERMRVMFRMIQDPFTTHSPDSRKNFLSYSFVLRKFVGLLRRPDLKKNFPLLKSRTKLYQQDVVWRKICQQLNWRFEPSI